MIKFDPKITLLFSALAVLGLNGCALTKEEAEQAMDIVNSPSNLNTPQPDWETPFWERWSQGEKGTDTVPRQAAASFIPRNEPLANVALTLGEEIGATLPQALTDHAPEHGLLILPRGLVQDALAHTPGCDNAANEACRSALAVYPGARLVARIDTAAGGRVAVRIWDTALGKDIEEVVSDDAQGAARLLDSLASQAAIAQWSVRPFVGDGDALYIASGRVNGLAEGTELAVHEPGRAVRTPTGQVVAWHAGEVVGKARVAEWVGATLSRVESISGVAPSPDHRLSLAP